MEKKRWVFIFSAVCLAVAFSVSPAEAQKDCDFDMDTYVKDTNKCRKLLDEPGEPDFVGIDCDDTDGDVPDPNPCGDEDTTAGKKSIALIMKFDDMGGDNVQSDGNGSYVDKEGAGVGAGERSQPNPAASIDLGLNARGRGGRQLFLDITCEGIDFDGVEEDLDNCKQLPTEFSAGVFGLDASLPDCEVGDNFCSLGAAVRPYKVSCPENATPPCPDIFTMLGDGTTKQLMSYRLSFGGGAILIEVASAIGGDGGLDPGRCLSLLETSQRREFIATECNPDSKCNVEVTAFDRGNEGEFPGDDNTGAGAGDGENDAWRVVADGAEGVTALICLRNNNTSEVLGKATLFFGFNAIKKEGATNPF